jgi:signal transduction histidine kinase
MDAESGKKVFDRLYQRPDTLDAGRKGLGLGLYICRELVTRQGGKIWVESQPGQGSVFYFTLPIFSLAKLLYPVITKDNRLKGAPVLITVRLFLVGEASPSRIAETARKEAWHTLQRCILPDKNILLPRMASGAESETFFVVECPDPSGTETAAQRIREQLDRCKELEISSLGITVSAALLELPSVNRSASLEQLVNEISNRILELMSTAVSERAKDARRDLFRVMSQKVRTPLSVVMGYAGILRDKLLGELNPEQESALDKVMDHTYDLVVVINNILEVQRIEAGVTKVESHEVHVASLLDQLRSANEAPRTKALTVQWDYPSKMPVVITDGNKLRAILQNLINNAIKFTEMGVVTISAGIKPGGKQKARRRKQRVESDVHAVGVEFKVADTGIGMPEDAVPAVFEKFCRLEPSGADPLEGMGLGLYIVKTFTEMLGGDVHVESELGKGSVFTITIPLRIKH